MQSVITTNYLSKMLHNVTKMCPPFKDTRTMLFLVVCVLEYSLYFDFADYQGQGRSGLLITC